MLIAGGTTAEQQEASQRYLNGDPNWSEGLSQRQTPDLSKATPAYMGKASGPGMAAFDSLFGDQGYEAFLSGLTTQGASTAGLTPAQTQPAPTADPAATTAATDMSSVDSVAAMAKQYGWADPYAFNTDMLDQDPFGPGSIQKGGSGADGGIENPTYVKFKDPASRGITDTGRNLNRVEVLQDKKVFKDTETSGADDYTITPGGYKVLAGAVPGTKNHTALYYQYGKDGKFMGANFDQEESFTQGIAPLVSMAGLAFGLNGGLASLGGSINGGLGLGLTSPTAIGALGGGALGAGTAVLTGQDPLKGAALGAVGGGITAANPAGLAGLSGGAAKFANSVISNTAKTTLNRTLS